MDLHVSLNGQAHVQAAACWLEFCQKLKAGVLAMQGLWTGLMALTTLLLLLPPCHFTHVWHIASEQFNTDNDYSPVWESFRVSFCPVS